MKLLVNLTNVHRDEQAILKDHLEDNSWQVEQLTQDDINALISLVNHSINNRTNEVASGLSYTELLNLKNKLNKYVYLVCARYMVTRDARDTRDALARI